MRIGDYIRTKYGVIAKITDVLEDCSIDCDRDVYYENSLKDNMPMMEIPYNMKDEYIIKSSPNIINLIKKKDVVIDYNDNIYQVVKVWKGYVFTDKKNEYGQVITLVDYQIKKVITKEEFSSTGYEVK